jgi:serine/threonine protein phosphatase PrpC
LTDAFIRKLFSNKDLVAGETHPVGSGTAVVYSSREPGSDKEKNEDAAALFNLNGGSAVLAVADGVGGHRGGDRASSITLQTVQDSLGQASQENGPLRSNIIDAIEKANQAVLDLGVGAATTLAIVEIQANHIRPYHVGDSEVLVVGQRGKVKLHIVPHSPIGYAVESGMLDKDDAMYHEDRHLVSNLIGTNDMHIQVGAPLELSRRDTVLLASDGLADNLHLEEIVSLIRKGPLEKAAEALAHRAIARMCNPSEGEPSKPDDLTFILYRRGQ